MFSSRRSGQSHSIVSRETMLKKILVLLALMTATISLATVHTVNVNAISFSPANLTIQQGDTVRWVKPAGGFHNVEESNGVPPVFRSGDPTSSAFTYNFAFAAPLSGTFNYECIVHAGSGMVGTVTVEAGGNPPDAPTYLGPQNGSTERPLEGTLSWNPAQGADHYIVRLGTSNPPAIVNNNFNGTTYNYTGLVVNTQYFWQITSVNDFGSADGNVWSFRTIAPPPQATGPFPANNATNVPLNTMLAWEPADGTDEYSIMFGTQEPLNQIGVIPGTTIDPGELLNNTLYLWRVDTWNEAGGTSGQLWRLTTEVGSDAETPATPAEFQLQAAYPNPFNSNVRIGLTIAQESQTIVRIFDIVGQEVSTLVNSRLSAGEHQLEWNASGQAAGLYFLKCECAGISQTQKLIYLP